MKRELLTAEELITRMNEELHRRGVPEQVFFRGNVFRYQSFDEQGVNWSDQVTLGGSGLSPQDFLPQAAEVVIWARERFNLAPQADAANSNRRCEAQNESGERCENLGKCGPYCHRHIPKPTASSKSAWVTRGAEFITIAAGAKEIIESLIELWQTLPFGPSPGMPRSYRDLEARVLSERRPYRDFPDSITPGVWGAESVDWDTANEIHKQCSSLLSGKVPPEMIAQIDSSLLDLFRRMDPRIARMIHVQIGCRAAQSD